MPFRVTFFPLISFSLPDVLLFFVSNRSSFLPAVKPALNGGRCCCWRARLPPESRLSDSSSPPCAPCRGMAQMRKLACDGVRVNSRSDLQAPLVSARQEILTSLVSALDSVVRSTGGPTPGLREKYNSEQNVGNVVCRPQVFTDHLQTKVWHSRQDGCHGDSGFPKLTCRSCSKIQEAFMKVKGPTFCQLSAAQRKKSSISFSASTCCHGYSKNKQMFEIRPRFFFFFLPNFYLLFFWRSF